MKHALLILCVCAAACGSSPASAPSPTTSSVLVTLNTPLKVNGTAQATATATLSNGTTQVVTTGWQSDTPSAASVSSTGLVTGIGNGRATIFVVSGGHQGQQVVRVLPDYQGNWVGTYAISGCQQSGIFISLNFCGSVNGTTPQASLTITQNGESISGSFFLGTLTFAAFTGPIGADGGTTFTSNNTDTQTLINAIWNVNSTGDGRMTGGMQQTWRSSGQTGQGTFTGTIVSMTRTAGSRSFSTAPARLGTLANSLGALLAR